MEYRTTTPEEEGFEDSQEEFEAMHEYIAGLIEHAEPNDMMDSLLMMTNICQLRAIKVQPYNPTLATWYRTAAEAMRACLILLSHDKSAPKANAKLENPLLYYPEPLVMN